MERIKLTRTKPDSMKRKLGRPKESVDDKVDMQQVEHLAGLGLTDQEIGMVLGVSQPTVSQWRKRSPEFTNVINKGRTRAMVPIVGRMYQDAMNGNTTAQIFILKNRMPDRWKDVWNVRGKVSEEQFIDLKKLTVEELRNLRNIVQKTIQKREDPVGARAPGYPPKLRAVR